MDEVLFLKSLKVDTMDIEIKRYFTQKIRRLIFETYEYIESIGWWVLYLLTTCIPLLILLLLSTLTKDSTKAFIPLLAPEFLW